jgi:hypothetical protein
MKIIGTTERMCACCEKRTKHLKVIVNMEGKAVIVFMCTEKHGGKTEDPDQIARQRLSSMTP